MTQTKLTHEYRGKKENANAVQSTDGQGHEYKYKPSNKEERHARKRIWDRYNQMKDHELRKEAERRWDLGDKMYNMWAPERDPDDWKADIVLPDAFAAVQTHMQDTIQLRFRPSLEGVESSDETLEFYTNSVFQYAMDKTDFDIEVYKAQNMSAIRGDAYTMEEYRYEWREVQDIDKVEDGEITYKKRKIYDYDDVYTRSIDNWSAFIDETVDDVKYARDCIYREVMDWDSFKQEYGEKSGFKNCDEVVPAGSIQKNAGFFKKANDMSGSDVEILHYWNKLTDSYDVLANNVVIREGPLPSRHKELPIDKWTFYPIPGQQYGMGIPFIIHTLVEERRSGRNMAADRNKMGIDKMFLVNDLFDLDEDELTPRPHGMIKVNTNGLPINQAITALEYGDVPASSLRFDDALLIEERRAHGLDDRPAQTAGGTATESAIISEAAQKRINQINTLQSWTTLKSIGRKKWSNCQTFYPAGRMETIMEGNTEKTKMVYKTIKIDGQTLKAVGDPDANEKVKLTKTPFEHGSSRLSLDETYARFLEGSYDIVIAAGANIAESQAAKFAKITEMVTGLTANPITARYIDGQKTVSGLFRLANEKPSDWMPGGSDISENDMIAQAQLENDMFKQMANNGKIWVLPGTPGATEAHTQVHLDFTESKDFDDLPEEIQSVIEQHIAQEHEANPNTSAMAEELAAAEGEVDPATGEPLPPGGAGLPPGASGGPAVPEIPVDGGIAAGGDVTNAVA